MDFPFPIMVIVTFVASLGFALFFNVSKRRVITATVGGVLTWAVYYLLSLHVDGVFIPCVVASIFAAIYAETVSRITRMPVTGFFIIAVIPLIPGRSLYYTMYNAVSGNVSEFWSYALTTMLFAGGIAAGICIVTAAVQTWDVWAADKAKRLARMVQKQARRTTANGASPRTSDARTAVSVDAKQDIASAGDPVDVVGAATAEDVVRETDAGDDEDGRQLP